MLMASRSQAAESADFFESLIRPVLTRSCFACHTASKLGGLRLDSRTDLLKGGASGPAIVPGDPDRSLLIQAVRRTHEKLKMPPQGRLAEKEIANLVEWVRAGAVWPETPRVSAPPSEGKYVITLAQRAFWSFQPVRKPNLPPVRDAAWGKSPLDRLVLAKLEQQKLRPTPPADKRTLIRRATIDLTGLPPTPEEVRAFLADSAPNAFEKVVDRLLSSPLYGERWGRYWLDIARYTDDLLVLKAPAFYQYRDWVIRAFNEDMPYDLFVKAQIAGDLLPGVDNQKLLPALTIFIDPSSEFSDDDRVDVTTRGFLGLTAACAQCHDHKYDPIPTQDYYSLLGVFRNTKYREVALSPTDVVDEYQMRKKLLDDADKAIAEFLQTESQNIAEMLAAKTSRYLMAAVGIGNRDGLDPETLQRWIRYLKEPTRQHSYLRKWDSLVARKAGEEELRKEAGAIEDFVIDLILQKKAVDEYNKVLAYGTTNGRQLDDVAGKTLDRGRYMFWQDLCAAGNPKLAFSSPNARIDGVLYYKAEKAERFRSPLYLDHLAGMKARRDRLKSAVPPQFPYLSIIEDLPAPVNLHVYIRGNAQNPGEEAPRRFLRILSDGEPQPFTKGSGRLELAEAIASPKNPLTARVMVNRIWEQHFGNGIVRTPSNFGQTGDRPGNPELLDYLAFRFVESKWSMKALHREIMLSATYALGAGVSAENAVLDPENRFNWRFSRRRLDAEALRDSLLFVAGALEPCSGGPSMPLDDPKNRRRTVYGFISRQKLNPMLATFDFPNPNTTSEQRVPTTVPIQRLFLLNSDFIMRQAHLLSDRIRKDSGEDASANVRRAYEILFQRAPKPAELDAGTEFLRAGGAALPQYAQVLLSSNEFIYVE